MKRGLQKTFALGATLAALQVFLPEQSGAQAAFIDVGNVPAVNAAIKSMVDQGIMNGISPTLFDPHAPLTRGDFAASLTKMFNLPTPKEPINFPDVPATSPIYAYVEAAAPYVNRQILCFGCALGNNFLPNEPLTRAESTISLVRVLVDKKKIELVGDDTAQELLAKAAGASALPPPAKPYFATAISNGIVEANEKAFQLALIATRADIAVQLYTVQAKFKIPQLK